VRVRDFYTTVEAGVVLGVSASTVAHWVDDGRIRGFRTAGGHRRIPVAELEAFARAYGVRIEAPTGTEPPLPAGPGRSDGGACLLVVDDDADFGATVCDYMRRKHGWACDVVSTAFEAGVRAARRTPDAILLDIRLGSTDGFAVLAALRSDPPLAAVAVYACTGWFDPHVDPRIRAAGFAGSFRKPIDLATLGAVLARDHGTRRRISDGPTPGAPACP
jgi:excisionase family DNA binding protein